jgi:hypothetical protein
LKHISDRGVLPRKGASLQRRALAAASDGLFWTEWGWFMAWKQDLAKLKQQLGPETPAPAQKPMPKPALKPRGPAALEEEDAIFLSAMGLKPAAQRPAKPAANEGSAASQVAPVPQVPESFQDAVKDLKGLKPLPQGLPAQPASPPTRPAVTIKPPESTPVVVPAKVSAALPPDAVVLEPEPLALPLVPARFQLAAGMAIEVDGTLDLRGHSQLDAMDRLKDRLGDGMVLGWRSLLVTLGPDPALHEGLLALLASGEAMLVARYAQAPVPMGGTQAWLLYFAPQPAQP